NIPLKWNSPKTLLAIHNNETTVMKGCGKKEEIQLIQDPALLMR
ncbi:unnamed protein product, partial [Allacma fusca]